VAEQSHPVRLATPGDADDLARLLHDFNVEFDTPSPGNVDEADVDAQRFYERHGYTGHEPATGERAYYFSRELEDDRSSSAADE
jgi:hypothetical protein